MSHYKKSKKVLGRSSTGPLKIHHQIKFHAIGCVDVAEARGPTNEQHVMLVMFWHWILLQTKFRDSPVFHLALEILGQKFLEKILQRTNTSVDNP